jgi:pimeloyl-ACP methyl ester carboxylesterase
MADPVLRLLLATFLLLFSLAAAASEPGPVPAAATTAALCADPETPVASEAYVAIGGIEQWVTITGARCGNPIVLVVHGGPGNPLSPYAATLFAGWTDDFTVVQWDQRGAGRTFARDPAAADAPLTLEQMTADGVEVATHVAAALGQRKVILLGSSWGSALAVHMLKARPELFAGYVGASQLVQAQANLAASHARTTALAQAAGDNEAIAVLAGLGPPPWTNPRAFGQLRRITRGYEAKTTTPPPAHWWQPVAAYATPADFAAAEAGDEHSYIQFVGVRGDGMLARIDLAALGPDFAMPVILIQGEQDLVTTANVARGWFDTIVAPHKAFVLLPATGHDPNEAMLAAELAALRQIRQGLAVPH